MRTQVCCQTLEPQTEPVCARRVPPNPNGSGLDGYEGQGWACAKAAKLPRAAGIAMSYMNYCDDSSDCPAGQVCTRTVVDPSFNDSTSVNECKPLDEVWNGSAYEACFTGQPCRLPGTFCEWDRCEQRDRGRTCGSQRCEPDSVCCWRSARCLECANIGACKLEAGAAVQECATSRDCPKPRRCAALADGNTIGEYFYGGSSCMRLGSEICLSDDDCLPELHGQRLIGCERAASVWSGWSVVEGAPPELRLCKYED